MSPCNKRKISVTNGGFRLLALVRILNPPWRGLALYQRALNRHRTRRYMDERVDRTETKRAPDPVSRVTPVVHHSRRGYWILTGLILAGLVGGGWYLWSQRQVQQTPKTATAGR